MADKDSRLHTMQAAMAGAGESACGTWGSCNWEIDADGRLTIKPMAGTSGQGADVGGIRSAYTSNAPWSDYREAITSVVVEPGVVAPANSSYLFYGCSKLESLDLSGLDTSQVTRMYGMFLDCSALASLDLSHFDTAKATTMEEMFAGCSSLAFLDISGFDTDCVDDCYYGEFHGCDYDELPTHRTPDEVSSVFEGCSSLSTIVLGRKFSFDGGLTALFELPRAAEGSGYADVWEGTKDGERVVLSTDELEESYDGATMAGVWRRQLA